MALALDEPNDLDNVYDIDGFKYVINKEFLDKAKPVKVDFLQVGFKITSGYDLGAGCTSCGTKGTCCE